MRTGCLPLAAVLLAAVAVPAHAQLILNQWTRTAGSGQMDHARDVASDAAGNVYVTGIFSGTIDLDPGPGTDLFTSNGSLDVFVQKLDANGLYLWGFALGGPGEDVARGISIDGMGRAAICGRFQGIMDADPGPGTTNLTAGAADEAFVATYDGNGQLVWARALEGQGSAYNMARRLIHDGQGNLLVNASFQGSADLDPGPGSIPVTYNGYADVFIWKLDPNGDLVWVRNFGGPGYDNGFGIDVDATGNVYCSGRFENSLDIDPGPGVDMRSSNGGWDGYVMKLDPGGNLLWAGTFGGPQDDQCRDLALDGADNVLLIGDFGATADLDPGTGIQSATAQGGTDLFMIKLSPAGNLQWIRTIGGTGNELGVAVTVDDLEHIYFTGSFEGTVDMDPGPAVDMHTSNGAEDAYLEVLDPAGDLAWAGTMGGMGSDKGWGLKTGTLSAVLLAGSFSDSVDLDPGPNLYPAVAVGNEDAFVQRYRNLLTGIPGHTKPVAVQLHPNPATDQVQVELPDGTGRWDLDLWDATGRLVERMGRTSGGVTLLDLRSPPGTYVLRATHEDGGSASVPLIIR